MEFQPTLTQISPPPSPLTYIHDIPLQLNSNGINFIFFHLLPKKKHHQWFFFLYFSIADRLEGIYEDIADNKTNETSVFAGKEGMTTMISEQSSNFDSRTLVSVIVAVVEKLKVTVSVINFAHLCLLLYFRSSEKHLNLFLVQVPR